VSQQRVSGQFIAGTKGRVFVLLRQPQTQSRGCVLVVPPFAEEMNKTRRMITEVATQLVERGVAVVLPDLSGTGDSGGDFSDATWQTWSGDVISVERWSSAQGHPVTGVLAIRLGCALAVEALASGELSSVTRSVLWQPVFEGDRCLVQFLRLRIAANLANDIKESVGELRRRLDAGETLEVAGYRLSGQLAADLSSLDPPSVLPPGLGEVAWLEIVREAGGLLAVPSNALIERTRAQGGQVSEQAVVGEPFWMSTEIVVVPQIVSATVQHLSGMASSRGAQHG
jgi:exosortase A-associated hydrolase 2